MTKTFWGEDRLDRLTRPFGLPSLRDHDRLAWLVRAVSAQEVYAVDPVDWSPARRAVQELNNLSGEPLAEWVQDGAGCGIRLTPRGRRLSVAVHALNEAQALLQGRFGPPFAEDMRLLERVAVRTSARNQFVARILTLQPGATRWQVVLELANGQIIASEITENSAEALGLRAGAEVLALIKASAISILPPEADSEDGANRLPGVLAAAVGDRDEREFTVYLGGGLTAIALSAHSGMDFALGRNVVAAFSPSSILLGIIA